MSYVKIECAPLPFKVSRNYVWVEKLVLTNQAGLILDNAKSVTEGPIQNGVIVGLGPVAHGEGYRRGYHVLYRRSAAQEHRFLDRKLFLIFSSEIVSVKLDGPAPDHTGTEKAKAKEEKTGA